MSPIRRDILANFIGSAWVALVNLAAVPLYVRWMGVEAYGLVGLFTTLQVLLNLLDLGISPTMNRTLAAYSVRPEEAQQARDLVRTLEVGYWMLGVGLGLVVAAGSSWLSVHWVRTQALPVATVRHAFVLMAAVAAVQWPATFYGGGLMGLQRIAVLSAVNAAAGTLRVLGALVVLQFVSPTITAFFAWQVVMGLAHSATLTALLWRHLPRGFRSACFDATGVRRVWRFAAGMSGTAVLSLILTQLDKVVLSRVLPLRAFGYYVLASTLSSGLLFVLSPMSTTLYPRFTQKLSLGDSEGLRRLYHAGCQAGAVIALPIAIVMALFASELLTLWTQDLAVVQNAHRVLSILVCGTALNVLMQLPNSLQLAAGWTRLSNVANTIAVSVLVPLVVVLTRSFGTVGAASVWLILNVAYVVFVVPIMHRRLLRGEWRHWFFDDVGRVALAVGGVAALMRWTLPVTFRPLPSLLCLAMTWAACQSVAVLVAPEVRRRVTEVIALGWEMRSTGA